MALGYNKVYTGVGAFVEIWTGIEQDIENNRTTVTAYAYYTRTHSYATGWRGTAVNFALTVGGSTKNYSWTFDLRNKTLNTRYEITSHSHVINHGSDGTLGDVNVSVSSNTGTTTFGNIRGSTSVPIARIPRASDFTITGGTNTNQERTITIDSASSSFVHSVVYKFKDIEGGIASRESERVIKWTPGNSFISAMPNATSGTATLTVRTYTTGGTYIGTKSKSFTVSVDDSVVPSLSVGTEVSAGLSGNYIQDRSRVKVTITHSGVFGSEIVSRTTIIDQIGRYNDRVFTSATLRTAGTVAINTTIIDSRGRKATSLKEIHVRPYYKPSIKSLSAYRVNADGTVNPTGTRIRTIATSEVASSQNINTSGRLTVYYRELGNTTWIQMAQSATTGYEQSVDFIKTGMDIDTAYEIRAYITDAIENEDNRIIQVASGFQLMDFHKDGRNIALGKASENRGVLDLGDDMWFESPNTVRYSNGKFARYEPSSNANDITEEWVLGSNGSNYPGSGFWYVNQVKYNDSNIRQIAYGYTNDDMYTRYSRNGSWTAWEKVIKESDMQGHIIRGSNGNGEWTQYPDGTLICRFIGEISFSTSLQNQGGFNFYRGQKQITFPKEFASIPSITVSGRHMLYGVDYPLMVGITAHNSANSAFRLSAWGNTNFDTISGFQYIAIGRWK